MEELVYGPITEHMAEILVEILRYKGYNRSSILDEKFGGMDYQPTRKHKKTIEDNPTNQAPDFFSRWTSRNAESGYRTRSNSTTKSS